MPFSIFFPHSLCRALVDHRVPDEGKKQKQEKNELKISGKKLSRELGGG